MATKTSPQANAIAVSVIIPAYKAEATLRRALDSLLAQSLTEWEAIVIDDASPDDGAAIVKDYAKRDKRFRLISLEKNKGQSTARNTGILAAKGTWIALLDADDAYTPERLEKMVAYAEKHKLDMVADNQLFYDAPMDMVTNKAINTQKPLKWTIESHLTHGRTSSARFKWGLLKPIMDREFMMKHEVLYRPEYKMGEDSLIYAELLLKGAKAEVMPEAMYIYTTAVGRVSRKKSGFSTSKYNFEEKLKIYAYIKEHYRAQMTPHLLGLIAMNIRSATVFDAAYHFKNEMRKKNVGKALGWFVKYPALSLLIGRSFINVGRSRFIKLRNRISR